MATVLMVAPVALALAKKLDISPVPVIIAIAVSSNLQGAATLVGVHLPSAGRYPTEFS